MKSLKIILKYLLYKSFKYLILIPLKLFLINLRPIRTELTFITQLMLDRRRFNKLSLFTPFFPNHNITHNGHKHFFASLTPSLNLFRIHFLITVRACSPAFQPAVNTLTMKVVPTRCHKKWLAI